MVGFLTATGTSVSGIFSEMSSAATSMIAMAGAMAALITTVGILFAPVLIILVKKVAGFLGKIYRTFAR